eukprot:COSAG05_NODE_284_length_12237_cov_15.252266_4_plen_60_part_00
MISITLSQLNRHGCVVSPELPPCIRPSIGYTTCFNVLLSIPAIAIENQVEELTAQVWLP